MGQFHDDFARAGRLVPAFRRIAAEALFERLIVPAPPEVDMERNSDLVLLRFEHVSIACRARAHRFLERYADDFTIRESRPSGNKTEMAKIIEGWGRYLIYGFETPDGDDLCAWFVGDLNPFRAWVSKYKSEHGGEVPGVRIPHPDGSAVFRVFNLGDMPHDFVIARRTRAAA